jgi:hypothetical protein
MILRGARPISKTFGDERRTAKALDRFQPIVKVILFTPANA